VLLGNGDGTFQSAVNYGVGIGPLGIASGDLDGDIDLDLAVVSRDSDSVSVLINTSGPTGETVAADLTCTPTLGTLPFLLRLGVIMDNLVDNYRTFAGRVDVTLASGAHITSYRAGYTNLLPFESYEKWWSHNLPDVGTLAGENTFLLTVMDVTPSPYNQPPFWPSGDTDTDSCTVTGIAP